MSMVNEADTDKDNLISLDEFQQIIFKMYNKLA